MAIPPSGKTEMIAANRARAAANRETRRGEKETQVRTGRAGPEKSTGAMRYPLAMMDSSTDYLRIQIAEYVPPGVNLSKSVTTGDIDKVDKKGNKIIGKNGKVEKEKGQIINSDFALETGTTSATSDTMELGIEGGLNALMEGANTLKNISSDPQLAKVITSALSAKAVGVLGGNVSGRQIISRATGQVFNPNLELLFDGVNIRSFPFSFEFFPRNPKEGEMVKRIIRTLKQSMLAKRDEGGGKIFISAPDIFQLTYMKGNRKHPFLNSFLPMALTNINISYTGSNTYSTFYDGTPTHMRMDLTFKELNPIYAEDYKGVGGVGY
jgi:hypothetical protein